MGKDALELSQAIQWSTSQTPAEQRPAFLQRIQQEFPTLATDPEFRGTLHIQGGSSPSQGPDLERAQLENLALSGLQEIARSLLPSLGAPDDLAGLMASGVLAGGGNRREAFGQAHCRKRRLERRRVAPAMVVPLTRAVGIGDRGRLRDAPEIARQQPFALLAVLQNVGPARLPESAWCRSSRGNAPLCRSVCLASRIGGGPAASREK